MKKILLLFVGIGFSAIPYVNIPIRINNQSPPQVVSIDINNDSVKYRVDHVIDTTNKLRDTVNYYLYGIGGYTGTGKQVRQSSPTLTGTANVASMVFSGTLTTSALSASQAVFTDGSKNLVSNALTGSGNVVMSVSPTISSPNISGGTGNFTTLQQGGVQAVTTSGTQTLTNKSISASQITSGTFGTGNYGITGDLTFSNPSNAAGTFRGVNGVIADNDVWYVGGRVGGGSNDGQLYLGTNDDGNEPIIFGTGNPSTPTQWANIQSTGVTSINGLFSSSGQIRANNSGGQGTYLELAKYQGALPGSPSGYYPVIKTDWDAIYFVAGNKYLGSIGNNGPYHSLEVKNIANDNYDVALRSDGQSSYIRTGKLGIGNNSPDSTLTVSGSGRFTGNVKVGGKIETNGNEPFDYDEGSFTCTWNGFSGTVTSTVNYSVIGKTVTLFFNTFSGTSNSSNFSATAQIPYNILPSNNIIFPIHPSTAKDNGVGAGLCGNISTSGNITFYQSTTSLFIDSWTPSGSKGLLYGFSVTYRM